MLPFPYFRDHPDIHKMGYFPIFLLLLVALVSCVSPAPELPTSIRPNVLFMIADDWSYPHAGDLGDPVVRTPTFDWIARSGVLFHNAYCASPSCSPSRASMLTGKYPHELGAGGNLWSVYPSNQGNFVDQLRTHGYFTGSSRKGWGPGDYKRAGYENNPAGQSYSDFKSFYDQKPSEQPFFFWFGSSDPHRIYETNTGVRSGMDPDKVIVPPFLPDVPCVRNDILDYYYEVERFDRECGNIIDFLTSKGELENTLVVITSDNGMPFPRAKANLYDFGTRMPLAICWLSALRPNQIVQDFVSHVDLAPTIMEAAQVPIPDDISGSSLLPDQSSNWVRDKVFIERERHANVRKGDLSYPMRAIRTHEYLYIRNFEPDRWPAGDPETYISVGQYGDVDNSISKFLIMAMENKKMSPDLFSLTFAKRPAEELYDVREDPGNLINLASNASHESARRELSKELESWMISTNDPRAADPRTIYWDTVEYTPRYQSYDFDLAEELEKYQMEVQDGGRFVSKACQIE